MSPEFVAELLHRLDAAQNADGGWGAGMRGPSVAEATALGTWALSAKGGDGRTGRVAAGLRWLLAQQQMDGRFPTLPGQSDSVWATGLAVLALARFPAHHDAAIRACRWLIHEKGRGFPWWLSLYFHVYPDRENVETDLDIPGWPWTSYTASWVEPTAYALVAIKTLGPMLPLDQAATRVAEGEAMLRQRSCPGGGWNYGNGRVLERDLWPFPDTTALALLALRDRHPTPDTVAGLEALHRSLQSNGSGLANALGAICLRSYGLDVDDLPARIQAAYDRNGFLDSTRVTALAVLALDETGNHFRVPEGNGS
jgi:hypothetical protein